MMPAAGRLPWAEDAGGDGAERLFLWPSQDLLLDLEECVVGPVPKRAPKREREEAAASDSGDPALAAASAASEVLRAAAAGGDAFALAMRELARGATTQAAVQAALDTVYGTADSDMADSVLRALGAAGAIGEGPAGQLVGAAAVGRLLDIAVGSENGRADAPLERVCVDEAVRACLRPGASPEAAGWAVARALLAAGADAGQTRVARLVDALREDARREELEPVLESMLQRVLAGLADGTCAPSALGTACVSALARVVSLGGADDGVAVLRGAEGAVMALGAHVASSEDCPKERCAAVAQLGRAVWSRWGSEKRPELVRAVEGCMRAVVAAHSVPVARATLRAIERAATSG
uniref:Uncharacterized protein n=1 Tax=Cafeteria roenbergensis TaxID=33653 RepID=A0A7S0PEK6_CAFRO